MSNFIFPTFQGWSWEKTKTPLHSTTIYENSSGLETRKQNWSYPKYKIELKYNFLTDNSINSVSLNKGDLETLQGFYNSVGGAFDDFLFLDDVENSVTNQAFGVGDGITKQFQLVRSLPNAVEPVRGIIDVPVIKINGVATTAFTFDNYGLINFAAPLASGVIPTFSGKFYFRVRFQEDSIELTRTWEGLWEDITVKMITVK